MSSSLFLLEVLVYRINFESVVENLDNKNDISVNLRFSEIMNVDIAPETFPLGDEEVIVNPENVKLNMGKTYLFFYKPKELISELKALPLELQLRIKRKTIGTAKVQWKSEFGDMVKIYETIGVVKSVDYNGDADILDTSNYKIGSLNVFIRLSCFGESIETDFRMLTTAETEEFIFMNPKTMATFKCEKYNPQDTSITPISSLYQPVLNVPATGTTGQISWTELFGGGKYTETKLSVAPMQIDDEVFTIDKNNMGSATSAFDIVSMVFRPPENKFFDFLNMVSAEVNTKQDETTITLTIDKQATKKTLVEEEADVAVVSFVEEKKHLTLDVDVVAEDVDDPLEMTADKIARKLCKNRDCPAAKKFKEFGIGPLATGKGLGTLYGHVEPPVTYGLSHTYGTLSNYGPYGVFTRPKDPNQPFVAPKNNPSLETPPPCSKKSKTKRCCSGKPQVRGGSSVLRLRGGGPVELDLYGPQSPFVVCKPVMEQFDQILLAYKRALGPCGEASCPYSPTLTEANCRQKCEEDKTESPEETKSVSCDSIPCNMEACPYRENTNRFPAGCGSPRCAYAKYKLGLVDDDAALELQFLPPAISGKCGHPKCNYPLQPDLPPIHWDCPDPLPKGNCKNPQCPFLPAELKALKCNVAKKGPCGSTSCPYALPPPCDAPTCPFRQKPCPFLEQQQRNPEEASCSSTAAANEEICENPDCPFADKAPENVKGEFTDCSEPDHPLAGQRRTSKDVNSCSNTDCARKQTPKDKSKPNKKIKKKTTRSRACGNPECPFAPPVPKKEGNRSRRRSSGDSDSICKNPACPSAAEAKKKDTGSVCENPNCPYNATTSKSTTSEGDTCESGGSVVCGHPECPFLQKEELVCKDPYCPYAQPLPSCGLPECPYEPVPFCQPPVAAKSQGITKKRCSNVVKQDQGEEAIILVETETTVVCENEDCEGNRNREGVQRAEGKPGKGKRKRGKFVYSMGDRYPGVKIGHKECVTPLFNVPPRMGWLWNVHTPILRLKPRRGWKPGAIIRTIAQRIRAHRQMKGLGMLNVPTFRRDKTGNDIDNDVNVSPKPTLHIQKKDGSYWITMNPLKDPKSLADNEDPYMECTPMQFKITKNKLKQKNEGEDDSKLCCCEEDESSSSSDSELDIEFTPPAGIIHPERFKKKKNVIHCDTQYETADFEVKKLGKEKSKGGKESKANLKGKGKGGKDKKKKKK